MEELSIEETNKLRISLGLKPLPVPNADSNHEDTNNNDESELLDEEQQEAENWRKDEIKRQREFKSYRIKKNIEENKLKLKEEFKRRNGKTIVDFNEEEDDEDAESWVKKLTRKKDNKGKSKSMKSQETRKIIKKNKNNEYTEDNLKGLKVRHTLAELGNLNEDTILTLKDRSVLDNSDDDNDGDDDVLESTALLEQKKLEKKLKDKKGKIKFRTYEDDNEDFSFRNEDENDENNNNNENDFFILNGSTINKKEFNNGNSDDDNDNNNNIILQSGGINKKIKINLIDIDEETSTLSSDYQKSKPIKFKKIKKIKKIKSNKRQRDNDDNDIQFKKVELNDADVNDNGDYIDEENFQSILLKTRRNAIKKRKILSPEELAEQIEEEKKNQQLEESSSKIERGGIVIDDTAEFLSDLLKQNEEKGDDAVKKEENSGFVTVKREENHDDVSNIVVKKESDHDDVPNVFVKKELDKEDYDVDMEEQTTNIKEESNKFEEVFVDEDLSSTGLASALKLLERSKELDITSTSAKEKHRKEMAEREWKKQNDKRLVEKQIYDRRRKEEIRNSLKNSGLSAKEREIEAQVENRKNEIEEARRANEKFKDWVPEIKIEHRDDDGRLLNEKEAFKQLSHHFHGKGPGKKKIEKRIKKHEEEEERKRGNSGFVAGTKRKNVGVRLQ